MRNALDMSPMEAIGWFQTPVMNTFSPGGATIQIAFADPMRVVLIMGNAINAGTAVVGINSNLTSSTGLFLSTTAGPMIVTQAESGPLVAMDWFCFGSVSDKVSVIEIKLRDWPRTRAGQREMKRAVALAARFSGGRNDRWPIPNRE